MRKEKRPPLSASVRLTALAALLVRRGVQRGPDRDGVSLSRLDRVGGLLECLAGYDAVNIYEEPESVGVMTPMPV